MRNKKTALASVFLAIGMGSFMQAYANGAYLYCTSTKDSDTKYAMWNFKDSKTKQDRVFSDQFKQRGNFQEGRKNSVWIEGELGYRYNKPNLVMLGYEYKELCAALVQMCQDQYGSDYGYIGAGGGPTVYGWNGVAFRSNGTWLSDARVCPNWWVPKGD
jgi:hypothetical protein